LREKDADAAKVAKDKADRVAATEAFKKTTEATV
jgi:hypothetical protein